MWKIIIIISVLFSIIGILFVKGVFVPDVDTSLSFLDLIVGMGDPSGFANRRIQPYLLMLQEHRRMGYILLGISAVGIITGVILRGQKK